MPTHFGARAKDFMRCLKNIHRFADGQASLLDYDGENLTYLKVLLSPTSGLYEGGHFSFMINLPMDYPSDPPNVVCGTHIYHPNINLDAGCHYNVCLSLFDDWSEGKFGLEDVINGLLFLLNYPNVTDPWPSFFDTSMSERRLRRNIRRSLAGLPIIDKYGNALEMTFEKFVEYDAEKYDYDDVTEDEEEQAEEENEEELEQEEEEENEVEDQEQTEEQNEENEQESKDESTSQPNSSTVGEVSSSSQDTREDQNAEGQARQVASDDSDNQNMTAEQSVECSDSAVQNMVPSTSLNNDGDSCAPNATAPSVDENVLANNVSETPIAKDIPVDNSHEKTELATASENSEVPSVSENSEGATGSENCEIVPATENTEAASASQKSELMHAAENFDQVSAAEVSDPSSVGEIFGSSSSDNSEQVNQETEVQSSSDLAEVPVQQSLESQKSLQSQDASEHDAMEVDKVGHNEEETANEDADEEAEKDQKKKYDVLDIDDVLQAISGVIDKLKPDDMRSLASDEEYQDEEEKEKDNGEDENMNEDENATEETADSAINNMEENAPSTEDAETADSAINNTEEITPSAEAGVASRPPVETATNGSAEDQSSSEVTSSSSCDPVVLARQDTKPLEDLEVPGASSTKSLSINPSRDDSKRCLDLKTLYSSVPLRSLSTSVALSRRDTKECMLVQQASLRLSAKRTLSSAAQDSSEPAQKKICTEVENNQ